MNLSTKNVIPFLRTIAFLYNNGGGATTRFMNIVDAVPIAQSALKGVATKEVTAMIAALKSDPSNVGKAFTSAGFPPHVEAILTHTQSKGCLPEGLRFICELAELEAKSKASR